MARVKNGFTNHHRHKKVLKAAKGYYGAKHSLYRTANEQVMNSLVYAYRDRKNCKREFRKLWIQRINAAVRNYDLSYSRFIAGLNKAEIIFNRKILSEMAINQPEEFAKLVLESKAALTK